MNIHLLSLRKVQPRMLGVGKIIYLLLESVLTKRFQSSPLSNLEAAWI